MNRVNLVGGLTLIAVAIGAAFASFPRIAADAFPGPFMLPETLAREAPKIGVTPMWGIAVPGVVALLVFLWRRRRGASWWGGLLPAILILIHPATVYGGMSHRGLVDLVALAVVALGASMLASERTGAMIGGLLSMVAGVLFAPSGGALSALAAFALIEPRGRSSTSSESAPLWNGGIWNGGLWKGGILLLLYGIARAGGLGSMESFLPLPDVYRSAHDAATLGLVEAGLRGAAVLLPDRPLLLLPTPGDATLGVALVLFLGAAAILLQLRPRLPSRIAPLLAIVSFAMIGLSATQMALLPATALLPGLILVAITIAAIGTGTVMRQTTGGLIAVVMIAMTLGSLWRARPEFPGVTGLFLAAAPDRADAPLTHPLRLASLRSLLPKVAAKEALALGAERVDGPAPADVETAAVDRDLAITLIQRGEVDAALDLMTRALPVVAPDATLDWRFRLDLVDMLLRGGRLDQAVDLAAALARQREASKDAAEAMARLAMGHASRGLTVATSDEPDFRDRELAASRTWLDRSLELDPKCVRALLDRGRLRMARGDGMSAVADFEDAAEIRPDLAEPHIELAKLWFSRELDEEGGNELLKAQQIAGIQDPDVMLLTAQLMLAKGDIEGAVVQAEALQPWVHALRGGKTELAELFRILSRSAEDLQGASPETMEAMCRLALHYGDDRSGEVTDRLFGLLKRAQRHVESLQVLRDAEARKIPVANFERELSIALKNVGLAEIRDGSRRRAYDHFLEAVQRSPTFDDLGSVPVLLRSLADELDDVDRGLLGDAGQRAFKLGRAALEAGELPDAIRCFNVATELVPLMPFPHLFLAEVYLELDRHEEAVRSLNLAIQVADAVGMSDISERAAELLRAIQQPDDATKSGLEGDG